MAYFTLNQLDSLPDGTTIVFRSRFLDAGAPLRAAIRRGRAWHATEIATAGYTSLQILDMAIGGDVEVLHAAKSDIKPPVIRVETSQEAQELIDWGWRNAAARALTDLADDWDRETAEGLLAEASRVTVEPTYQGNEFRQRAAEILAGTRLVLSAAQLKAEARREVRDWIARGVEAVGGLTTADQVLAALADPDHPPFGVAAAGGDRS